MVEDFLNNNVITLKNTPFGDIDILDEIDAAINKHFILWKDISFVVKYASKLGNNGHVDDKVFQYLKGKKIIKERKNEVQS